ncbi:hypothetical protein SODALDRAFT_375090 [Sodiomyces alkalinus F11]|uniref:Uncharacterized protein n=1 Tax=Sodiomyces alkalinus (strain CBS 110278 / VKM F-3762 / F11) TaxID=1314773 RepID=A0A3N2Q7Z2_SODAK|nr:hypothetical protein SODALDRAFT_375090 [Sodiomyces alkalinus F11]ROT42836.1 hypothetical protein SODALDRAFT_375090 [Sodiomyces alkalinus F11]
MSRTFGVTSTDATFRQNVFQESPSKHFPFVRGCVTAGVQSPMRDVLIFLPKHATHSVFWKGKLIPSASMVGIVIARNDPGRFWLGSARDIASSLYRFGYHAETDQQLLRKYADASVRSYEGYCSINHLGRLKSREDLDGYIGREWRDCNTKSVKDLVHNGNRHVAPQFLPGTGRTSVHYLAGVELGWMGGSTIHQFMEFHLFSSFSSPLFGDSVGSRRKESWFCSESRSEHRKALVTQALQQIGADRHIPNAGPSDVEPVNGRTNGLAHRKCRAYDQMLPHEDG